MFDISKELTNSDTQCLSLSLSAESRHPAPHTHCLQWPVPAPKFVLMEGSQEPGPRCLWGPILGYEETSTQVDRTWNIILSFPPSELQDQEHTKEDHKCEQAIDEYLLYRVSSYSLVLGMYQRLATDHPAGGQQFANT